MGDFSEAIKLLINDYQVFMCGGESLFDWSDCIK